VKFTADEIADATGGCAFGPPVTVSGVATDSRSVEPGVLFVPIRQERDGHDFINAATEAGAAAHLSERGSADGSGVVVADTVAALLDLVRAARNRLDIPVVAITGSVGKTTTKDLVASVLGTTFVTHASAKSYNNHIGVPLTVLNADEAIDALVVEVGANGPGEIASLVGAVRPTIGIVTRVAAAHTEGFGTLTDVAREKGALVRSLPASGHAVLNADDELVSRMADDAEAQVVTFGSGTGADIRVTVVDLDDELRPLVSFESPWGTGRARLGCRGAHQATNAGAAITVGLLRGIEVDAVALGLESAALSPSRMDLRRTASGMLVLDDAYNANPTSMAAALHALAALPADRHVAVVGRMAELGALEESEHAAIGRLGADLGIEIWSVGAPLYGVEEVGSIDAAHERLGGGGADLAVLVKGSRVANLDKLAARLLNDAGSTG
jgi:UDP-N-acetylmuramoyl-tripeptide--D-alanyl-D-alanine ligase